MLDAVGCLSVTVMGFLLVNAGFVASMCIGGVESRLEVVLFIRDRTEVKSVLGVVVSAPTVNFVTTVGE